MKKFLSAFTLAEVIITLSVLGIVAAVTIPITIHRHLETADKTKLKKSMAIFNNFVNRMVVENELKNNSELKAWAEQNDCENVSRYFKQTKLIPKTDGTSTNCRFKTADGVSWDFSSFPNATFSLKEEELDNVTSNKTYSARAHFDEQGILRVQILDSEEKEIADEQICKNISDYHDQATIYMIEEEKFDLKNWLGPNCEKAGTYFDIKSQNGCNFTTNDGSKWEFNAADGSVTVSDGNHIIKMGQCSDGSINCKDEYSEADKLAEEAAARNIDGRIQKNVSNYNDFATIYMVENDSKDLKNSLGSGCSQASNYFLIKTQNGCNFTTTGGTYWQFNETDGSVTISDKKTNPKYTVKMGVCKDGTVNCQEEFPEAYKLTH